MVSALFIVAPATTATADIYRYLNEDGVECYTDTPSNGKAAAYMKDPPRKSPSGNKSPTLKEAGHSIDKGSAAPAIMPVSGRITSVVGLRHDPFDGLLRNHQGFDIAAPSGTPIHAIVAGRVAFSGTRPGYGKTVIVEHDDGMITLYGHNSLNVVATGDTVSDRTVIALTGSTGRSTGPHLHFEAWKDGANITSSILGKPSDTVDSFHPIRRFIGSDGSLVFTNLR